MRNNLELMLKEGMCVYPISVVSQHTKLSTMYSYPRIQLTGPPYLQ